VIESIEDPAKNFEINVAGTFNVLQAMRERHIGRLVNASTGGTFIGKVDGPAHKEMATRPLSPYGSSKLAVEGYCSAFAESYALRSLSLPFSNVYG
jgi:UDP-glucose 4-epimerase